MLDEAGVNGNSPIRHRDIRNTNATFSRAEKKALGDKTWPMGRK
jgi:hypothetical protein